MASTDTGAHWRDIARTPRFYIMDALAAFPLLLFFLHMRLWTFIVAVLIVLFLMALERFKFTIPVFIRWTRSTLAGPIRVARPWWRY